MGHHAIVALASIGVVALLCQWFAWRVRLPAILFLLLIGILAGPVTDLLHPQLLFGNLFFPFIELSVAVILFEGSLSLVFKEIVGLQKVVRNLVTVGLLSTWSIVSLSVFYLLHFSIEVSILFGAISVVTGPTVIMPILRTVRPNQKIANILKWEGVVIDPIGALLVVLVYEFIISSSSGGAMLHTGLVFGEMVFIGSAIGLAVGELLGRSIRSHMLPEFLQSFGVLTIVFGVYALSSSLVAESGLLAVTMMGIRMANMKDLELEKIVDFKESLSILLISMLFIILAAELKLEELVALGTPVILLFLVIQFVARPVKILISTIGSDLTWQEKGLLSWIAPRGIVAAAVSALFAIRLQQAGFAEASVIVPLTFMVIIGTVVLQSSTAGMIARWLKVAEPDPKGFLIIGANSVARSIAGVITENGQQVLLADTNWENIKKARMLGFPVYYGNPISNHAENYLDLTGIGKMLALSPNKELNIIASIHFRHEFGSNRVFSLLTSADDEKSEKHEVSKDLHGYIIFGKAVTYHKLLQLLSSGAEVKTTKLTDSFTMQDYMSQYGMHAVPLFAIKPNGKLDIFVDGYKMTPEEGWSIISLVEKQAEELPEKIK